MVPGVRPVIQLVVGTPDLDHPRDCPACGYTSLLAVPVHLLTMAGLTLLPTPMWACTRCERLYDPDDGPPTC